ncbi:MAG: AMP-binding protein, partial [Odoribacter sp.]|nr:AMP-binding protein [Odoribacter sp.]
MKERLLELVEDSIKTNWNLLALTDYKGISYTYKEIAEKIEKLKILFEEWEIAKGDKIAFCSRNMAHWGITYLAILSYGAIAVPIPYEFKSLHICQIIAHCEAKLFFVGNSVYETLHLCDLSQPKAIIRMEDFSVISSTEKNIQDIHKVFKNRYPNGFTSAHLQYRQEEKEEIAMICYTSGTDANSRGVMISYHNLWSNLSFINSKNLYKQGEKLFSVMTLSHI